MPSGFHTQTVCVLLREAVTLEQLRPALAPFTIRREISSEDWTFGGPTFVLDYRPDVNGLVAVDVVDKPWPDGMGDPKQEFNIFGAWTMGMFGSHTYPGGLQRAMQQCWAWEDGKWLPTQHQGFIRIRSSYVFGKEDAAIRPADYDAEQDLEFVTKIAQAVLALPQALCYFNPNGEVLRDQALLDESIDDGKTSELPPLDLWANIRLFRIDDTFSLMDTVGNAQLDLIDFEAVFSKRFDCGEVDGFFRNATLYLLNHGDVIKDKDTLDGPGDARWQAHLFKNGLCDPPRNVLCFVPVDDVDLPEAVLNRPADD
jgi:hypothetical protein